MTDPAVIDWFAKGVQADRIFTPTTPVDEKSLFAGRNDQVRSVIDVINQKGQHGIVYGERGVGKTSLMNVLHAFLGMPNVVAPRINCDSSDTFQSGWEKSLAQAALTRTQRGFGFTPSVKTDPVEPRELLGERASPDSVRRALSSISGIAASNLARGNDHGDAPHTAPEVQATTRLAMST